jgi:hypothetical protein
MQIQHAGRSIVPRVPPTRRKRTCPSNETGLCPDIGMPLRRSDIWYARRCRGLRKAVMAVQRANSCRLEAQRETVVMEISKKAVAQDSDQTRGYVQSSVYRPLAHKNQDCCYSHPTNEHVCHKRTDPDVKPDPLNHSLSPLRDRHFLSRKQLARQVHGYHSPLRTQCQCFVHQQGVPNRSLLIEPVPQYASG